MSSLNFLRVRSCRGVTRALFTAFVLILFGCATRREREHVQQTLARADRARLVADTRHIWTQYRSEWSEEVPRAAWPPSFHEFKPEKVVVDGAGVFVCTYSLFVHDVGLYVAVDPAFDPMGKTDPTFEPLGDVFFWYDAPG